MKKTLFNDLLASIKEARDIADGKKKPSRHFKVTAILEGAATIDYIKVSGNSIASDLDFKYYTKDFPSTMIGSDEDVPPQELWYHRPDTTVNEETDLEMTWKMIGMGWEQEETPAPHINNIKKFTPKIIK